MAYVPKKPRPPRTVPIAVAALLSLVALLVIMSLSIAAAYAPTSPIRLPITSPTFATEVGFTL